MKFIIQGGKKLEGEIRVAGAKNAATPIIAATLLTKKECIIQNVPRIADVEKMLEILRSLGSIAEWTSDNTLRINNGNASPQSLDKKLVKSLRSSILLLGPFLGRFDTVEMEEPGGCIIGNRPVDTHMRALTKLGAEIEELPTGYRLKRNTLQGAYIVLQEASVTATENIIMAATLAQGSTTIVNAATEPHVKDLCTFLSACGAHIEGAGTSTIRILGVRELDGTHHRIIPDTIEAGTFIILGIATKSEITVSDIDTSHMEVVLEKLLQMGAPLEIEKTKVITKPAHTLRAERIKAQPYPAIPTDLQSLFGILATQATGTSLIHDTMFEGRMGYINELTKMGASAIICDPHRVLITGPTPLYGTEITGLDLRAGAAMIIAGLLARGTTTIHKGEIIDRGYERVDERLRELGADISRAN